MYKKYSGHSVKGFTITSFPDAGKNHLDWSEKRQQFGQIRDRPADH